MSSDRLAQPRRLSPVARRLSVVVPMYDEQDVLPLYVARARPVLDGLVQSGFVESYEILLVDDGSTDRSREVARDIGSSWNELVLVELRRNAGQQLAIAAGLRLATGDWVVTMDVDLQDPPELLPDLLDAADLHHVDVFYTSRADRSSDGRLKAAAAGAY